MGFPHGLPNHSVCNHYHSQQPLLVLPGTCCGVLITRYLFQVCLLPWAEPGALGEGVDLQSGKWMLHTVAGMGRLVGKRGLSGKRC